MVETKSELSSFSFEVTEQVKMRIWIFYSAVWGPKIAQKRDQLTESSDKKREINSRFS